MPKFHDQMIYDSKESTQKYTLPCLLPLITMSQLLALLEWFPI